MEEKTEQIVNGAVVKRRGFANGIVEEKPSSVMSHLRSDVLIPGIKKILNDLIKNASDWFFYGVKGAPSDRPRTISGNVSYSSYYDRARPTSQTPVRPTTTFTLDEISIPTRGEAETVLMHLQDHIARYGTVSAGKYYDLVGVKAPFTTENYGWRDLTNARVRECRGGYIIEFPRMEPLN